MNLKQTSLPQKTAPSMKHKAAHKPSLEMTFFLVVTTIACIPNLLEPLASASWLPKWNSLAWTFFSLVTTVKCFWVSRQLDHNIRRGWLLIGMGCFFWFSGQLVWDYHLIILNNYPDFPSYADIGYLGLAPLLLFGLIRLYSRKVSLLYSLIQLTRIAIILICILIIHYIYFSQIIENRNISFNYILSALSYPLFFLSTLFYGFLLIQADTDRRQLIIHYLLLLGVLLHTIPNILYSYIRLDLKFYNNSFIDILWILAFIPIYVSAKLQAKAEKPTIKKFKSDFNILNITTRIFININSLFLPLMFTCLAISFYLFHKNITSESSDPLIFLTILFVTSVTIHTWLSDRQDKNSRELILQNKIQLDSLLHTIPYGVLECDLDGSITYCNQSLFKILNINSGELLGRKIWENLCDENVKNTILKYLNEAKNKKNEPMSYICSHAAEDRNVITLKTDWNYRFDINGKIIGLVSVISDITRQQIADGQLRQAATVFNSTTEAVAITDFDLNIIKTNRAFSEISGFEEDDVFKKPFQCIFSEHQDTSIFKNIRDELFINGYWHGEAINRRKDGELYYVWINISIVEIEDKPIDNCVVVFSDISKLKKSQEHLHFLAHHDPLTKLPNRTELHIKIDQAIRHAIRSEQICALFFIDLDQFKHINDSLGHATGDRVLIEVSKRLLKVAREEDVVARLGGDEFVILMENISGIEDTIYISERIIEKLTHTLEFDNLNLHITPSIGIALCPKNGTDTSTLMKNADAAMYRAKENGRNCFAFYSDELTEIAAKRVRYENMLRIAIEKNQFSLHYQPQYDTQHNQLSIVGVETLIRWHHPEEGPISPGQFIPFAEECNLIIEIGRWVLEQACAFLAEIRSTGLFMPKISINVSGKQFLRSDFIDTVTSTIHRYQLKPEDLVLEITESTIMRGSSQSELTLNKLRELGVFLAIDDFGTGYSSLSYLKLLPVNCIKIDQSFIRDISVDKNDEAIVRSIIALSRALDLDLVAEGVETQGQLQFLQREGCHVVQGYLLGKPMSGDALLDLLRQTKI